MKILAFFYLFVFRNVLPMPLSVLFQKFSNYFTEAPPPEQFSKKMFGKVVTKRFTRSLQRGNSEITGAVAGVFAGRDVRGEAGAHIMRVVRREGGGRSRGSAGTADCCPADKCRSTDAAGSRHCGSQTRRSYRKYQA